MNRRNFLGLSSATLTAASLHGLGLNASAQAPSSPKKMLFIFLRGGNDAINSVIPHGDPEYTSLRPTLSLSPGQTLDLGNGWAGLHPSLGKIYGMHQAGELASIQRVGYPDGNLSHFSGQRFIETAKPGDHLADDGFVNRWAVSQLPGHSLPVVCVSREIQRMFKGSPAMPHIPAISEFLLGDAPVTDKLKDRLRDAYDLGGNSTRELLNDSSDVMLDTIDMLQSLPPNDTPPGWYPTDEATAVAQGVPADNWALNYFGELRDAVRLLKQTDTRITGVEIPLWDQHSNQGKLSGHHPDHLAALAHGMLSVKLDTQGSLWNDLCIVVLSEFGRASAENASLGTDHGRAGLVWVAGGSVAGGVYNCDSNTWPANETLFSDRKWVAHLTDYRSVLGELFRDHMGSSPAVLEATFPGWSTFSGPEFAPLQFIL